MNYCKSENIMATAVSMLTFFLEGVPSQQRIEKFYRYLIIIYATYIENCQTVSCFKFYCLLLD